MKRWDKMRRGRSGGFSLVEMMVATVVLLVGLVAVAQLVPTSALLNYRNRTDSSALVLAQRELDLMLDQPITQTTFTDPQGLLCPGASICSLGDPTAINVLQGSPVVVFNNQSAIDFSSTAGVPNFSITYQDPADPSNTAYDVRWAVIITGNGTAVSSKRFIVGVRQQGGNGYLLPVTLDTMVQKK